MMKKFVQMTVTVMGIFLLTACSTEGTKETTETTEETIGITVVLVEDNQEFSREELTVDEGESLQNIMEMNYQVEMENGFISGIDGHKQDAGKSKYWMYDVNGEQPDVGAVEYFVVDGDVVTWTLNVL